MFPRNCVRETRSLPVSRVIHRWKSLDARVSWRVSAVDHEVVGVLLVLASPAAHLSQEVGSNRLFSDMWFVVQEVLHSFARTLFCVNMFKSRGMLI